MTQRIKIQDLIQMGKDRWSAHHEAEGYPTTVVECDQPLEEVDLSGWDFRNLVLRGLACRSCNLISTSFSNADLSGAMINRCQFTNAVFENANLEEATFLGGNGAGSNFARADLRSATFTMIPGIDREEGDKDGLLDLVQAQFTLATADEIVFSGCDLSYGELRGLKAPDGEFLACDLSGARFDIADDPSVPSLDRQSDLRNVDFDEACTLMGTHFSNGDLTDTTFSCQTLSKAVFKSTVLRNAYMRQVRCDEADFENADLSGADLGGADLRSALNVRPSRCYTLGARMPLRSKDLWSILRADYTGSRLIFILIFMSIFLTPLALKAAGLVALNRVQVEAAEKAALIEAKLEAVRDQRPEAWEVVTAVNESVKWPVPELEERRLVSVLIGMDRGWLYAFLVVLPVLVYQALRAGLTWLVGRLRDEEVVNGYSPAYRPDPTPPPNGLCDLYRWAKHWLGERLNSYGWLSRLHQLTRVLLWVALASSGYNMVYWLLQPVWVPT